ncbi:MAG: hypothetical protein ACRC61_12320, partial [Aeromonas salmonicida]
STDTANLVNHCLKSTYFVYNKEFYEQVEGCPMGSPISPVVANIYMTFFETIAIETTVYKPKIWWRYVDDVFAIWPHGTEKLNNFLDHLNNRNNSIKFTMEVEVNNRLPFLDVLLHKKEDGTLGHSVFRKETHTNLYLNAKSNHPKSQKLSVLNTLVSRATRISDQENLRDEQNKLRKILESNGYKETEIKRAFNRKDRRSNKNNTTDENKEKEFKHTAVLPYVPKVTDRVARTLSKHNIKPILLPTKKIGTMVGSVKDPTHPLHNPGVYAIPCQCGSVYIGQTGRTITDRIRDHIGNVRRCEPQLSGVAKHLVENITNPAHAIDFDATRMLIREPRILPRIVHEAIEVRKNPSNMNAPEDKSLYKLSDTWTPLIISKCTTLNYTMHTKHPNVHSKLQQSDKHTQQQQLQQHRDEPQQEQVSIPPHQQQQRQDNQKQQQQKQTQNKQELEQLHSQQQRIVEHHEQQHQQTTQQQQQQQQQQRDTRSSTVVGPNGPTNPRLQQQQQQQHQGTSQQQQKHNNLQISQQQPQPRITRSSTLGGTARPTQQLQQQQQRKKQYQPTSQQQQRVTRSSTLGVPTQLQQQAQKQQYQQKLQLHRKIVSGPVSPTRPQNQQKHTTKQQKQQQQKRLQQQIQQQLPTSKEQKQEKQQTQHVTSSPTVGGTACTPRLTRSRMRKLAETSGISSQSFRRGGPERSRNAST